MVKIIGYKERETEQGKVFFVLELQGGIEMIRSKETGKFYATIRKTTIPTTFDENTCKSIIGTEMPGSIEKETCEPYQYTVKETGELIELSHRYSYIEEVNREIKEKTKLDTNVFSENGILEPVM